MRLGILQASVVGLAMLRIVVWVLGGAAVETFQSRPGFIWITLVFGAASAVLIRGGRDDPRATDLGIVYLLVASVYAGGTQAAELTGTPFVVFPAAFIPYFSWRFFTRFPRAPTLPHEERRARYVANALLGLSIALFLANLPSLRALQAWLGGMDWLADWLHAASLNRGFWTVVGASTLPAIAVSFVRLRRASPDEQRRVRVFLAGVLLGGVPSLAIGMLAGIFPALRKPALGTDPMPWLGAVERLGLITLAVVTMYAVLARQALALKVLARQGLRYLLARNALLGLTLVPFSVLLTHAYVNRQRSLEQLLEGPGLLFVLGVTASGLVLLKVRRPALVAIDRRFFREAYDARRTLVDLVSRSRETHALEDLAELLRTRIDDALHVGRVTLMLLDGARGRLVAAKDDIRPISASSPLASLLASERDEMTLSWDPPSPSLGSLGEVDREWLADSGFHLIFPLRSSTNDFLGLIGIGDKKSELPFTSEDRELLKAIADSVSLTVETASFGHRANLGDQDGSNEAAATVRACRVCSGLYGEGTECPSCGAPLDPRIYPRQLAGKYRLVEVAGRGGMGIVFRGRDEALGRDVAIKTLPRTDPARTARLRREARAMAMTSHPNLGLILAFETWRGVPFLILEYLPGGTLADRLKESRLSLGNILQLGRVLAGAVQGIHDRGLLHRDIKPSNVAFDAAGTPKLLDFGLARLRAVSTDAVAPPPLRRQEVDPGVVEAGRLEGGEPSFSATCVSETEDWGLLTGDSDVVGTYLYLPPEAFEGAEPGIALDLWALHVVLYEAIGGVHPLRGLGPGVAVGRLLTSSFPPLTDHVDNLPPEVVTYFNAALAREPSKRPGTAKDVARRMGQLSVTSPHS